MNELSSKSCKDCRQATAPMGKTEVEKLRAKLQQDWNVINNHHLLRTFKFKNFKQALHFTNKVGELAESEGHHPDVLLKWGEVQITLYTHKVDGLTESDFIMAAKIDALPAD